MLSRRGAGACDSGFYDEHNCTWLDLGSDTPQSGTTARQLRPGKQNKAEQNQQNTHVYTIWLQLVLFGVRKSIRSTRDWWAKNQNTTVDSKHR